MRWDDRDTEGGIRFSAAAGSVEGYDGRGVDGMAFTPRAGYLFRDQAGDTWWVIFQPYSDRGFHEDQVLGDILACSAAYDEMVHVRVLAHGVRRADAEAAFRQGSPFRYEEAVEVARRVPHAVR
ncbi:hypothetical protein ACHMXB_22340 (plasmid) [Arthrobacter sp. UC242_113]|uniref:hypothetical protein n=1 Tax=Arthrobacter sp. UC242_113 TaxID=3374550 RepID=UPI0037573DC9